MFDLGANVTYQHSFAVTDLQVKLAVYNLLNQERVTEVDEDVSSRIGNPECGFRPGHGLAIAALRAADVQADF